MKPVKGWAVIGIGGGLICVRTTLEHARLNCCKDERIARVLITELPPKRKRHAP